MALHTLAAIAFGFLFIGAGINAYRWSRRPENEGKLTDTIKDTW